MCELYEWTPIILVGMLCASLITIALIARFT
jgi:hypothetical protein